jgi:hypothetical protein
MDDAKLLKAVGTTKRGRTLYSISFNSGLSYGQTAARVKALVKAGKVKIVGKEKATTGRPATLYTVAK